MPIDEAEAWYYRDLFAKEADRLRKALALARSEYAAERRARLDAQLTRALDRRDCPGCRSDVPGPLDCPKHGPGDRTEYGFVRDTQEDETDGG